MAFTSSSISVMIGNRITVNAFEPRLATLLAMYWLTPEMRATTTINVATDRMIPSNMRKERILCARSVSRATPTGSRRGTRRFMNTAPCCSYAPGMRKVSDPAESNKNLRAMKVSTNWLAPALRRRRYDGSSDKAAFCASAADFSPNPRAEVQPLFQAVGRVLRAPLWDLAPLPRQAQRRDSPLPNRCSASRIPGSAPLLFLHPSATRQAQKNPPARPRFSFQPKRPLLPAGNATAWHPRPSPRIH